MRSPAVSKPEAEYVRLHGDRRQRFKLVPFDEISLAQDGNYIIKGLIPREGLVVIWGPPKCGKSFWTFDILMHVAMGWEYRGRRVKQGSVVYVACEGERGLGARAAAFRRAKLTEEATVPDFYLVTTRLDLVAEHQELIAAIADHLGDDQPVAICVDTLNRSIRGSESSDSDMGDYIKAADVLRATFGCTVIVIHHCGIESSRPRGHTSLTGAADAQIAVKKDKDTGVITCTLEFMKDGPDSEEIYSTLEVVELGEDLDGDEITSCVIRENENGPPKHEDRLTPQQQNGLDCLNECIIEHGQPCPDSAHIPAGVRVVTEEQWRKNLTMRRILNRDGNPREQFKRIRDGLLKKKRIGVWGDYFWCVAAEPHGQP